MNINADLEPSVDSLDEIMGAPARKMPRLHAIAKQANPSPAELVALAVQQMGDVIARSLAAHQTVVVSQPQAAQPPDAEKAPSTMTFIRDQKGKIESATVVGPSAQTVVFLFNRDRDGCVASLTITPT